MRKIVSLIFVMIIVVSTGWSQVPSVTGKITDPSGNPIPSATVKLKGGKGVVVAKSDGSFTIHANSGDVLQVTAINFEPSEVTVNGNEANLTLRNASGNLQEVVVTTALGVQRQAKELGYATASVNSKTLTQGKSVNVQQALNGKVSGLNVSTVNSGVFENAKINIRGIRSLTGNNQPMLVVDGAPTPLGYLSSIPPDDVADLTVLKSAASAAIYGPDAVNGVIVITTKRGAKNQAPTITLSSTLQATEVSFFPKLQKSFGQGAGETVDQYGNYDYVPYENQQYGPAFDGTIRPIGVPLEDGSIQMVPYSNDHYKDKIKFFNSGLTLQNSASIAAENFYVSVEDAKIKGLIPDDQNHRTSFRFNAAKQYGKFSVNFGLNYILQNYDVVNEAGFQTTFPDAYNGGLFFLVMQTANNIPLLDYKDWQNGKFAQSSNYYNEYAVNPYWLIGNIRQRGRSDDILGNLDVNYQFLPWLKGTARLSTNLSFANFKNTNAAVDNTDWANANRNATQFADRPGYVFDDQSFSSRINLDYFLSGDHDFTNDFSVRYILGGAIRQNRSKDVGVGGNSLVVPGLYNVAVRSGDANVPLYPNSNYNIESRLLSAYGNIGFSYKGWANIEFTGRNDWDSRLLKENRSFFYPGVNAALVLSDAIPSLANSNTISYLKVRGAVSKSGNVNLGAYALQPTYSQPAGFPYGGTVGFTANGTIPAENLKPEFVNTKEVGIELGFLKNRINASATYFFQKNTNQILLISQSSSTGYPFSLANAADFKNYGVEMDLNLSPVVNIGRGKIDFRINATYNDNQVTHTQNNDNVVIGGSTGFIQNSVSSPTASNIAVVGMPAFAFQLSDYARDPSGRVIVDGSTGNPTQASGLVIKGRSLPLWILGATPSYSVGNFSVSMTWDYKGGHDFFSGLGSDEDFAGISKRSAEYGRQRFVFPNSSIYVGPEPRTDADLANPKNFVANTNTQVQDGNYNFWSTAKTNTAIATNYFASAAAYRLREVNISYNLPTKWFGRSGFVKRVTISAIGKNLLLFVPKSNQWGDPEFNYSTTGNTFGIASSFQAPAGRLFGGSLTVQF